MTGNSVLLRCNKCKTVNRVPVDKLMNNPKCGKCKTFLKFSKIPVEVTAVNFDQEVLAWPGVVLVEFWAPWCGHCRTIAPALEEIAHKRAGYLKVVKVNTDSESFLASRYSIRATPTLMLYRNGIKLSEIQGALPKTQLESWIDLNGA